jgi:hypothetical protein
VTSDGQRLGAAKAECAEVVEGANQSRAPRPSPPRHEGVVPSPENWPRCARAGRVTRPGDLAPKRRRASLRRGSTLRRLSTWRPISAGLRHIITSLCRGDDAPQHEVAARRARSQHQQVLIEMPCRWLTRA